MEGSLAKIVDLLVGNGLSGVVILVLGFAVYRLYTRNEELQEKRIDDGKEAIKAMESTGRALDMLTAVVKDRPK